MSRLKITLCILIIAALIAGGAFFAIIFKGYNILIVPQEFATISEAMAKAKEGYTVLLMSGNYNESVVLKSGVSLKGEEGQEVSITVSDNKEAITVQDCNNVVIENIAVEYIESETGEPNDGIFIRDSNVTILICSVEKCMNGVNIDGSSNVEISRFTGKNNNGFGVFAGKGTSVTVRESFLEDNGLTGIGAFKGRELRIEKCISSGHKYGGFESRNTERTIIKDSKAVKNDWGVGIYASEAKYQTKGSYAKVAGTTAADNNDYGISIYGREEAVIKDNISINNGSNGISCYKTEETEPDIKYEDRVQIVNNVSKSNEYDGIYVKNIKTVEVSENVSYGNGRYGFAFYQPFEETFEETTLDLSSNTATSNGDRGIFCYMFKKLQIKNNDCRGNGDCGLAMAGSSEALFEGNVSSDNKHSGLLIQHTKGDIVMLDNTCKDNFSNGISVSNSDNCRIENNRCDRNNAGIHVDQILKTATVNSNRCLENKTFGIGCHNVIEAYVFENECSNNTKNGMRIFSEGWYEFMKSGDFVTKGKRHTTAKAYSNRCIENREDGILCSGVDVLDLSENESSSNKNSGIKILAETEGKIRGNICSDNYHQGIYLDKVNKPIELEENECRRNGAHGFCLSESGSTTVSVLNNEFSENFNYGVFILKKSKAKLSGNNCENNRYEGLHVENDGTRVEAFNNTFKGNYATGIVYCDGAAGTIDSNFCVNQPWSGITIKDRETKVLISNNTIGGNDCWGIAYLNGGRAELRDNTFQGNGIRSIRKEGGPREEAFFDTYFYLIFGLLLLP